MFKEYVNPPERICPDCGAKMELLEDVVLDSFFNDEEMKEMYWKCTNNKCGCCLTYEGEGIYED